MPVPKLPHARRVLEKIKNLNVIDPHVPYVTNRNPRNLEMLKIAYKNEGYHLEAPGKSFWIKLGLETTSKYITANAIHLHLNEPVVTASTQEWAIKKQLYKPNDVSAFVNLARVFSRRCIQSGITEMQCNYTPSTELKKEKLEEFLSELQKHGLILQEPERSWKGKPWEILN